MLYVRTSIFGGGRGHEEAGINNITLQPATSVSDTTARRICVMRPGTRRSIFIGSTTRIVVRVTCSLAVREYYIEGAARESRAHYVGRWSQLQGAQYRLSRSTTAGEQAVGSPLGRHADKAGVLFRTAALPRRGCLPRRALLARWACILDLLRGTSMVTRALARSTLQTAPCQTTARMRKSWGSSRPRASRGPSRAKSATVRRRTRLRWTRRLHCRRGESSCRLAAGWSFSFQTLLWTGKNIMRFPPWDVGRHHQRGMEMMCMDSIGPRTGGSCCS